MHDCQSQTHKFIHNYMLHTYRHVCPAAAYFHHAVSLGNDRGACMVEIVYKHNNVHMYG